WEDMKCRYNPDETSRIVIPTEEDFAILRRREYFFGFHFSGPFWQLREWLGFEKLCTMFYDDPILIGEMLDFWNYYVATLLRRAIEKIVPDYVYISEDMAYKCFSMISPEMTRKYLLPVWKNWGEIIRNAEIPIYAIDSDGFIGELIPIWIDAGINVCEPIEVAAGNDICAFRKKFGKNMAYRGGVDKREIAKGGNFIEKEIERIRPVIDDGGFIPSCDHGVPADVSWSNFVHYTKVLAKVTGWM
ncbi:MAG TPA: uroporphyrinogen decarboxylase family protein, partial [Victivallales bacterium]|nr:uroporphyrinogen decarboxylase family protein [Victivallales bacterium]